MNAMIRASLLLFSMACLPAAFGGPAPVSAPVSAPAAAHDVHRARHAARRLLFTPSSVAVASFTAAADGSIDPADPSVVHDADRRMPLGSSIKILVLGAFADAVENGGLDPTATVTTREWERFYMPDTDGGAHAAALDELELPHDAWGFALDQDAPVTLQCLAELMIHHSDNAAFDYFLRALGPDRVASVIERVGLVAQDVPASDLGSLLMMSNHEIGTLDAKRIAGFRALTRAEVESEAGLWRERFLEPEWRAAEFAWRLDGGASEGYALQARALQVIDNHGTAREFARMTAAVAQGRFLDEAVSRRMAHVLEWPLRFIPGAPEAFERWGEKGGSIPGVLTDNNFTVARVGDFAGRLRITVVFVDGLGAAAWNRLHDGELLTFEQRLMADAEFVKEFGETLGER